METFAGTLSPSPSADATVSLRDDSTGEVVELATEGSLPKRAMLMSATTLRREIATQSLEELYLVHVR